MWTVLRVLAVYISHVRARKEAEDRQVILRLMNFLTDLILSVHTLNTVNKSNRNKG